LLLAAAAALAQQLAPAQAPLQGSLQVYGAWRIEQARVEPVYDRARARLEFGPDGVLSGHTGCNTLQARYTLQGAQLVLGTLTVAAARCGRLQMEQEDRILSALEAVVTARVRTDGLLELRDADGRGVLRATRWAVPD
jgi:heat shock protein HslJ